MDVYNVYSELFKLSDNIDNYLEARKNDSFFVLLDKLRETSEKIGIAWSQSWIGYHSCVYYENFNHPPRGAVFSSEWGLYHDSFINPTRGDWIEYNYNDVIQYIMEISGGINLNELNEISKKMLDYFEDTKSNIISTISIFMREIENDKFVNELNEKINNIIYYSRDKLIKAMLPHGTIMSRDSRAMTEGIKCPPHIAIIATVGALKSPYQLCKELSTITRRIASHIEKLGHDKVKSERIGTRVFIGHGGSKLWRELKDFIQDRMHLPWDEFNRVPVAGVPNAVRLSEMMDNAAIAFLILTAEDEQNNGKMNPRMNVVHEAGLFQGRLGFEKAIILLEEGCEEFSNINGLGQIRFPSSKINAVFEDIRQVLEREGLIDEP
jgi:predicted nucleotide-binding protein